MRSEAEIKAKLIEEEKKLHLLDQYLNAMDELGFGKHWEGREFLNKLCYQDKLVSILKWILE